MDDLEKCILYYMKTSATPVDQLVRLISIFRDYLRIGACHLFDCLFLDFFADARFNPFVFLFRNSLSGLSIRRIPLFFEGSKHDAIQEKLASDRPPRTCNRTPTNKNR